MEIEVLIREIRNMYAYSLEEAFKRKLDLNKYKDKFNKIESTILELNKYKQMWEEFENIRGLWTAILPVSHNQDNIQVEMERIKRKYFPPKPVKKYVTIEVESEKESEVDDGISDIKELVDNMGCPKMKIANSWVEVDNK